MVQRTATQGAFYSRHFTLPKLILSVEMAHRLLPRLVFYVAPPASSLVLCKGTTGHTRLHMYVFLAPSLSLLLTEPDAAPVLPSCASYIAGLVLYASHFPECYFVTGWWGRAGGGSHALWHCFIVVAIRSHWMGMGGLRDAAEDFSCAVS